jgi:hypothetical protein
MRTSQAVLASAGLAFLSCAALGQTSATGTVFLDGNNDGVRQSGERGIPGVPVSDGVRVVLTDGEGRWELPVTGDDHFFVIKPRGYRTPVDGHGIPQFGYIHKPDGSPDDDFIWAGVEPTGPLPASIDFPLIPSNEPETFRILVMGDPQPYSEREVDYYRADIIDPILGRHDITFGVSLGDLVGDRLDLFEPLNQAQSLFGVPWYNVYGNHDMNFLSGQSQKTASDPDRWADETFERVYGPANYAFQYGRVHFITLDNVIHEGFDGFRDGNRAGWPGGKWPRTRTYRGGLRDHQLDFIENYLKIVPRDELVVLMFHIPMAAEEGSIHQIPERGRLFEILSSHPHTLSMSGHTHFQRQWFFGEEDGYRPDGENQHTAGMVGRTVHHHINAGTASGSWYRGLFDEAMIPHTQMRCGSPNGYTVIEFDGNRYTSDYFAARRDTNHIGAVTIGEPGTTEIRSGEGETGIVANIFNGSEVDTVRMRIVPMSSLGIRALPWTEMAFAPQVDPTYQAIFDREKELAQHAVGQRDLPDPVVSYHIWESRIPANLPAGTHRVEIEHTDMYGRTRMMTTSFRVAAD